MWSFTDDRSTKVATKGVTGELDIDKPTIVGNTYGEFNVEKYATLRPDPLGSTTCSGRAKPRCGCTPQIEALATAIQRAKKAN